MFTDAALAVCVAAMVPLMLTVTWFDLRYLRIPNWAVLGILGVFLATGSWGLPFDTFLWRLGYGAIALVAGFAVYSVVGGKIGAGDLKLLAALAPYLYGGNLLGFIVLYIVVSLLGLGLFYTLRWQFRGSGPTGWKALDQGSYFPAGILLGVSMMILLVGEAVVRFT